MVAVQRVHSVLVGLLSFMKEFELIKSYFAERGKERPEVALGVGDDAAIVKVRDKCELLISTDTLVEGVHFFKGMDPRSLGHKAIAVNLSDIAAMGGEPAWISLALTLPSIDQEWVAAFADGVFETCQYYNVQVIGGDTTQGPLSITVTVHGLVPEGKALKRSGAKPGDYIYVTGSLGDAGVAVAWQNEKLTIPEKYQSVLRNRLECPTPRVAVGQAIRDFASAAIDVSDGVISDLQHIMNASGVGAAIDVDNLPLSQALRQSVPQEDEQLSYALAAGDDYELLFTVPSDKRGGLEVNLAQYNVDVTCIGQLQGLTPEITLRKGGEPIDLAFQGFQHFQG